MPLDGTPVPPTAQPSVSRISRRVASSAAAGIPSVVTAEENSLRRRVYDVIAVPPVVLDASAAEVGRDHSWACSAPSDQASSGNILGSARRLPPPSTASTCP